MNQRVVVLGGGPAGDVCALRAAQLGADVMLVERAELGGTCLNWGCIPTKSLLAGADLLRKIRRAAEFGIETGPPTINFARMMERKEEIVVKMRSGVESACARKKVKVVRGQGAVQGDAVVVNAERYEFDRCVIAVGTEPAGLPGLDMRHPAVITSNGVLRLEALPKKLIVLGGGVIGCEFASLFAALGSHITIVEVLPRILAPVDQRTAAYFQRLIEKENVSIMAGRKLVDVCEYRPDGLRVRLDDGTQLEGDKLLVSIGRAPQTLGIGLQEAGVAINARGHIEVDPYLRTANPKIYAVGDCIGGLQLAHKGSAEGHRAAENALDHHPMPMDYTVVPSCIYTHPEIAMVGLNADTAKDSGRAVKIGQARFAGDGKALAEGEPDGYVQIVADAVSDQILGATIVGVHAVELIHEIGVAMSDALGMDDLGSVIHAHPTISEMVMEAAQQGEGVAAYLS
ncbi:MAG: dihydrolipoyl dehydrogenase [Candidatus Eremiobacteraeota bacterium]|nr:dihydrolipoyl dehydrogenase [Candidatus Eremiobacteraeota bacterium]